MQGLSNPVALPVTLDTTGAKILEGSVAEHDGRDIYLPNHVESVSHIAIDIGGSLAKVVYFTRVARPTTVSQTSSGAEAFEHASTAYTSAGDAAHPTAAAFAMGSRSPASTAPASLSGTPHRSRESSVNISLAGDDQHSPSPLSTSSVDDAYAPSRTAVSASSVQRSRSNVSHSGSHISQTADGNIAVPAGTLTPTSLFTSARNTVSASAIHSHFMKRRSLPSQLPGGRLNFVKFETADITSCVNFLRELISLSAKANNVSLAQMRKGVKLMATGGGAHLFYDLFESELGIEVRKEEEMDCLITGLNFITLIPEETYYYSDELVDNLSATSPGNLTRSQDPMSASGDSSSSGLPSPLPSSTQQHLPRPSPDPPLYSPVFDSNAMSKLPCLLVNIGSGVSIIKVAEDGKFERVSGTSLGGGTLWGMLSLVTDAESFDEMLEMASRGDNSTVDMLVSDVYGASDALNNLGLKSTTIASSFGKVFRKDKSTSSDGHLNDRGRAREERRKKFRQEDICKSLLYAISNNIGQIAYMNAEKFGLDRIYFGGYFIRGHPATIATLSYAIRFWSKGSKRAFFLRHEGYLGALGAWIRQFYDNNGTPMTPIGSQTPTSVPQTSAVDSEAINKTETGGQSLKASHIARFDSDSNNATPRGNSSQSQTITPALSRQQSSVRNPAERSSSSPVTNGINPLLAEALGGSPLNGTVNTDREEGAENEFLSEVGVTRRDLSEQQSLADPNSSLPDEDESRELTRMLESLSTEDRQLFGELMDLQSGTIEGEEGGEENMETIAELLKKMDVVNGAADGLEDKLDNLLARLDNILHDAEEEHAAVGGTADEGQQS